MRKLEIICLLTLNLIFTVGLASADLNDGLVAYYPFNGNANDESGNGNHGIVHGATLTIDRFGNTDSAYSFDQIDYIDCGNDQSLRITGELTISAWIKINLFTSSNQGIVAKWWGQNDQCSYGISIDNQLVSDTSSVPHTPMTHISSTGDGRAGFCNLVSGNTVLSVDGWYHIVGVFIPDSSIAIYVDGVKDIDYQNSISSNIHDSTENLVIGTTWLLDHPAHHFNGSIDDIRIYNRALTELEIYQLKNYGKNPTNILSPVSGQLGTVDTIEDCQFYYDQGKWCFNQHQSGAHEPLGGIGDSDDTYAWDINLNYPTYDSDNNKPVYSVADGIVENTYAGSINVGGTSGQVLISHEKNGKNWWSGYLHLRDIQVEVGQTVSDSSLLGFVSNIGTNNNHLHFVVYEGENSYSKLVSFDTNLIERRSIGADLDGDGDVDGADLLYFAINYGRPSIECENKLKGTWIGHEVSGTLGNWASIFSCNTLELVGPQEWHRGVFVLNKATDPYFIDFIVSESYDNNINGNTFLGIYKIESGILSVAFNPPGDANRPTTFVPEEFSRVFNLGK